MSGHGALLLLSPVKQGQPYRLRYYQLDEGKGRLLGLVPFSNAVMVESLDTRAWAFAISGTDPSTNRPITFAGDVNAIHARLENASDPHFSGESISLRVANETRTLPTEKLLGWQAVRNIYSLPAGSSQAVYLQIFPNGTSATAGDNSVEHGRWISNGVMVHITSPTGADAVWQLDKLQTVMGMQAESRLTVRLLEPLSSRTSRKELR